MKIKQFTTKTTHIDEHGEILQNTDLNNYILIKTKKHRAGLPNGSTTMEPTTIRRTNTNPKPANTNKKR